jgi:hypothetical protein
MDIMNEFRKQHGNNKTFIIDTSTPKTKRIKEQLSHPEKLNPEFILFKSKILNDKFLLVYHKESIKKLRKEFPGIAMYSRPEIQELLKHDDGSDRYTEFLRKVHFIKKTFGGWIKIN